MGRFVIVSFAVFLSFFFAVAAAVIVDIRFHLKWSTCASFVFVRWCCCCRYLVDDLSLWVTFFSTSLRQSFCCCFNWPINTIFHLQCTPTQSIWADVYVVEFICFSSMQNFISFSRCRKMKENSKLDESREWVRRSQRITAVDKKWSEETTINMRKYKQSIECAKSK